MHVMMRQIMALFVEYPSKETRDERSCSSDMAGMCRIRDGMGAMAKSLERDPQLESLLAVRKQQLGISMAIGRGIKHDLATSIGFDIRRTRIGI